MLPEENQREIVARYLPIEDPQERLALIVEGARRWPAYPEALRDDAHRVQGCVSRVWLAGVVTDGLCQFQMDADSTLVKGLAGLLCAVYQGTRPVEAAAFSTTVLDELHLVDRLSPTRRHGLEQVSQALQAYAAAAVADE